MVTQVPEDILLKIIKLVESDVETLRSCALTSRAWARDCQRYIFRKIDLYAKRHPEVTFSKLRGILKENPSLADYTRELRLFIKDVESEENSAGDDSDGDSIELGDPADYAADAADYAQFLGSFNRLEKVSFTQDFLLGAATRDALVDTLARVFELETLRTLTLIGFDLFPTSLLTHATHVTDLQLHSCQFSPDNQISAIPPFRVEDNRDPTSVCSRIPVSLTLKGFPPWSLYLFAGLARERRGIFESRYIDKLVLAPPYDDGNSVDVIEPCCKLLRAVGETQQGAADGVESLSHFELKSETLDFIYPSVGSVLPPSITSLVLHLSPDPYTPNLWHPTTDAALLQEFLIKLASSGPRPLRQMELRTRVVSLPALWDIPDALLEIDQLLSSKKLFPSFQEFRFAVIIPLAGLYWPHSMDDALDVGTLKKGFEEKEVRRWFPSLAETGRVVVEWDVIG